MHCNFAFVLLMINWSLIFVLHHSHHTIILTIFFRPIGCLPLNKYWSITQSTWSFLNFSHFCMSNWIIILDLIDSVSLVLLLPLRDVFFTYHADVMEQVFSILLLRLPQHSHICNRLLLLILRDRLNRAALMLDTIGSFAKYIAVFNPELTWVFFSPRINFWNHLAHCIAALHDNILFMLLRFVVRSDVWMKTKNFFGDDGFLNFINFVLVPCFLTFLLNLLSALNGLIYDLGDRFLVQRALTCFNSWLNCFFN